MVPPTGGAGVSERGRRTAGESTGQKWGELTSAERARRAAEGMEPEQYPGEDSEEGCGLSSLDTEERVQQPPGILKTTAISERSEIAIDAGVTPETKPGAESPATHPVLLCEGDESVETYGKDRGNISEEVHHQPTSRTCPGVTINAELISFESGKMDRMVTLLPDGAKPQDSEDHKLRENDSCALTMEELVEEIENIRVKYASSQAEISRLADKVNGSNCKVGLLELELGTEKERNQRHRRRIKELENETTGNSTLIALLSDCKTKVEQLEELKRSSQELIFKFQESKETAIHLRERITELESQQAIKEQRIKDLMDQLSECTKTIETKDEMEKQREELLNHQAHSRMSEQTQNVQTQNESTHHQENKSVSHCSSSSPNTSKVCTIL